MKRKIALRILNPILGILLINQMATGFLAGDLSPAAFEVLHEGGGIVFTAAAILHVALNWNWVRYNFFKTTSPSRG